jgi:hypothetical protein
MTFSDGTPSTVSEELAERRRSKIDGQQPINAHVCGRHCGTGYHPDAVTVQLIEQAEAAGIRRIASGLGPALNRTPCPDCGGGYWQEYIGPPPCDRYIVHASICPVVAS